ncbi:MAG: NAD(P)-dependent glycerol-3-phosphate dehydrogenase [Candidatus Saganbacteria bacterium]|nr:NAD(P)-dependent glycerol-3-phosphate dehydrogenase [Candidatus Saganbacteria bacterium]
MSPAKIMVIGAGAWGTTLAILLAEKGHEVTLWVFEPDLAEQMKELRENKIFLPGYQLPASLDIITEPSNAAELFLFAVPTQFLRSTAGTWRKAAKKAQAVICASKGIEQNTLALPLTILEEELKTNKLAALSGPNLSAEIAQGKPAACVIASSDLSLARACQEVFTLERFRVYVNTDPIGVQLGGALKNIIAIAAGIADGLELGNNAKAALMIRGFAEIARLGTAMGADLTTFAGLSGMGDLITTCSSPLSRNHCVGEQLARGKDLKTILDGMKHVAEGLTTTKAALKLAEKLKVELPLTLEVHQVLYEGKSPFDSLNNLMTRTPTSE